MKSKNKFPPPPPTPHHFLPVPSAPHTRGRAMVWCACVGLYILAALQRHTPHLRYKGILTHCPARSLTLHRCLPLLPSPLPPLKKKSYFLGTEQLAQTGIISMANTPLQGSPRERQTGRDKVTPMNNRVPANSKTSDF